MTVCTGYTNNEQAYLGHDNAVSIIPYSDYAARTNYDMTDVTLVEVSADLVTSAATGDDVAVDSDDFPAVVWWDQDADDVWQIHMKVGMFASIVAGEYKLRVVLTDPDYTNGIVIADDLLVDVVDIP